MLKELITPAKVLPVVKKFSGDSDLLGTALKKTTWKESSLPDVFILGITDARLSGSPGFSDSPDVIREQLYQLTGFPEQFKIADLGNVKTGNELNDTLAAVRLVAEEACSLGVPLLVLGGNQCFSVPLLSGIGKPNAVLTLIDDRIDNLSNQNRSSDDCFLSEFQAETVVHALAVQSFFVSATIKENFPEDFNGSLFTLGEIRNGIQEMEPYLRETDLVSFDFGALKLCEAPGQIRNSPNGLTGEEACQLAWYAGISTNPGWFSLFGYDPSKDPGRNGAMMAAQIAWYFLNGKSRNIDESPQDEAIDFMHFVVPVEGIPEPVTFLKHPVSKRWWMEVPSPDCDLFPLRIACSKKDYRKACRNEIPDRWWSAFNRTY
jgi:arginase family enzyme